MRIYGIWLLYMRAFLYAHIQKTNYVYTYLRKQYFVNVHIWKHAYTKSTFVYAHVQNSPSINAHNLNPTSVNVHIWKCAYIESNFCKCAFTETRNFRKCAFMEVGFNIYTYMEERIYGTQIPYMHIYGRLQSFVNEHLRKSIYGNPPSINAHLRKTTSINVHI